MVHNRYPTRKKGDESYLKGRKPFVIDPGGNELYARDRKGNEMYPKAKDKQFARKKNLHEYYARDNQNNEYYPRRKGRSLIIKTNDSYQMAKWANGLERYPSDAKGNEYYLTKDGEPILFFQADGKPYFAKTRRGNDQIPWNVSQEYVTDADLFLETRDVVGNTVFVNKPRTTASYAFCQCLCEMMAVAPSLGILLASALLG